SSGPISCLGGYSPTIRFVKSEEIARLAAASSASSVGLIRRVRSPAHVLELPARRAAVRGVEDLDRPRAQLPRRAVLDLLTEREVDERVRRPVAVVEEGAVLELGLHLDAVGAPEPEVVALEVDRALSLRSHRAALDSVA